MNWTLSHNNLILVVGPCNRFCCAAAMEFFGDGEHRSQRTQGAEGLLPERDPMSSNYDVGAGSDWGHPPQPSPSRSPSASYAYEKGERIKTFFVMADITFADRLRVQGTRVIRTGRATHKGSDGPCAIDRPAHVSLPHHRNTKSSTIYDIDPNKALMVRISFHL